MFEDKKVLSSKSINDQTRITINYNQSNRPTQFLCLLFHRPKIVIIVKLLHSSFNWDPLSVNQGALFVPGPHFENRWFKWLFFCWHDDVITDFIEKLLIEIFNFSVVIWNINFLLKTESQTLKGKFWLQMLADHKPSSQELSIKSNTPWLDWSHCGDIRS